jgi:hypothetical protein
LAQTAWVDDGAVLAPREVRVVAEYGLAHLAQGMYALLGQGLNLEEAAGVGHGLEVGARFGFRLDATGRGLRADQTARILDPETFGTGTDAAANPELRARARLARWAWGEAGVEDRLVLPIRRTPDVTEVAGGWLALHWAHLLRLDLGCDLVLGSEAFAASRAVQPALGVPAKLWFNVTRSIMVGAIGSIDLYGSTAYTTSHTDVLVEGVVGYRLPFCDVLASVTFPDLADSAVTRIGGAAGLACTLR